MKKQVSFSRGRRIHHGSLEMEMPFRFETESIADSIMEQGSITKASFKQRVGEKLGALKNFLCGLRCKCSQTDDHDHKRDANVFVLDPASAKYQLWDRVFMISCLMAIFFDPLFFYVPIVRSNNTLCFDLHRDLAITVTVLRTLIDFLYVTHIILQFRTAYVAPSSRVFGRGELVRDTRQIARRYMRVQFWLDLVVILPLPQVVVWVFLPVIKESSSKFASTKNAVLFLVVFHYVPRLFRMFFVVKNSEVVRSRTTGVFMETVWAGAAYNLLLYLLASHVIGACWYILTVERQDSCWRYFCVNETTPGIECKLSYFNCRSLQNDAGPRGIWLSATNISSNCVANPDNPTSTPFNFGIYSLAVKKNITAGTDFAKKYFYCLWYGLNSLSSLGQGFKVSGYIWEIFFAIIIFISGLLLFALLIGNVQKYLSSMGLRQDQMRVKRRDTEEWMNHRQLPADLRKRVRRYDQYKWVETQGVDEQALLQSLPQDLRRDIKRHLCLNLVRKVPLFNKMDDRLLDAICERLHPVLHIENSYLVQEGDPVVEMVFIIRGYVESTTTNGGRTGFFNINRLGPGSFCGEELLTWALDPTTEKTLPSSTSTVKATTEVEAFSLSAKDLKFVASQFRKLHCKGLQHEFRYHSPQWRTWAATFIQITWRNYRKRKQLCEDWYKLQEQEQLRAYDEAFMRAQEAMPRSQFRHSSIIAASSNLSKPLEPDFSIDDS